MELTLHVGLRKTATSTLQHVLHRSQAGLAADGLLFPCTPAAHHSLARRLRLRPAGSLRAVRAALLPIVEAVRSAPQPQVLLSSEHLVSIPETAVAELRSLLVEALPEARLRVLVYVREPVGLATSLCQQGVRNGVHRLAGFMEDPWPVAIRDWVGAYVRQFGREAVTVRLFDPRHLVGGDIARDVLHVLGVPDTALPAKVPRLNPAMSLEAVLVADALAELRPAAERIARWRGGYKRALTRIAGGRFTLSEAAQARVIAASAPDLAWLRAEFGLDVWPEPVAPGPLSRLTPDAARDLARRIVVSVES